MSFPFGIISILLAAAATAQSPPPASQLGNGNVTDSHGPAVVDVQPGTPINAAPLNRSTDVGQHETYFISDPTQRSGVMVFRDDALGTTIGVVATEVPESNDLEAGWLLERRFWQEKAWCINVTSLGWSEDGRYLFVATSDTYGSGNVYQLDLKKRLAAAIFPLKTDATLEEHCWSTHIDVIGKDSITVHARDYCEEDKIFARETLPFLTEEEFGSPPEKARAEEKKPVGNGASDLGTKPSR